MARRLWPQLSILGLALLAGAGVCLRGGPGALAQTPAAQTAAANAVPAASAPQEPSAQPPTTTKPSDKQSDSRPAPAANDNVLAETSRDIQRGRTGDHRDGEHRAGDRRDERREGDHRPGERPGGERREGGRRGPPPFIYEAVRRDGGPLELLPLLADARVTAEIGLPAEFKSKLEAYLAGMQKRWDEDRKAAEATPDANWSKLFKERLDSENDQFNKFLEQLTPAQRDRLIGIFVQFRSLRSLSNRLVAVEKLGMSSEQAARLQAQINQIRDEIMRENFDEMRRRFESGGRILPGNEDFREQVNKTKAKIDSRIEKLVDKDTVDKLTALRGKELSKTWLDELEDSLRRPR